MTYKPVVQIDIEKHPELANELAKVRNPRHHAERLRCLATGFLLLKDSLSESITHTSSVYDPALSEKIRLIRIPVKL